MSDLDEPHCEHRLFDVSVDVVCIADFDGRLKAVNPSFESILGYPRGEVLGRQLVESVHESDRAVYLRKMRRLLAGASLTNVVLRHRHRDGSHRRLSWNASSVLSDGLVYAVARDVTGQYDLEAALRRSKERIQALHRVAIELDHGSDAQFREALRMATASLGMDCGTIGRVDGDAYRVLYHFGADHLPGVGRDCALAESLASLTSTANGVVAIRRLSDSKHADHPCHRMLGLESHIGCAIRRDGEPYATVGFSALSARPTPWSDDDLEFANLVAGWVAATLQRRESVRRLHVMARHDSLTGLLNRAALLQGLEQAVHHANRYGSPLCVLMVDVDHFKSINDERGHLTGDHVLSTLGNVMRKSVRLADLAGRYGGEEFCLVMPETTIEGARIVAERLRGSIRVAEFQDDTGRRVTVSIGMARLERGDVPDDVLARADAALYEAKRTGRDRICVAPHGAPVNVTVTD